MDSKNNLGMQNKIESKYNKFESKINKLIEM